MPQQGLCHAGLTSISLEGTWAGPVPAQDQDSYVLASQQPYTLQAELQVNAFPPPSPAVPAHD